MLSEIEIALIATLIRLWRKGSRFLSRALKVLFTVMLAFAVMCGGDSIERNTKLVFERFQWRH